MVQTIIFLGKLLGIYLAGLYLTTNFTMPYFFSIFATRPTVALITKSNCWTTGAFDGINLEYTYSIGRQSFRSRYFEINCIGRRPPMQLIFPPGYASATCSEYPVGKEVMVKYLSGKVPFAVLSIDWYSYKDPQSFWWIFCATFIYIFHFILLLAGPFLLLFGGILSLIPTRGKAA